MRQRLVRFCQLLTAAAAIYTVLWACGRAPTQPSTRELAGTYEGTIQGPPADVSARLVLASEAAGLVPTLSIGEVTYGPNRNPPTVRTGIDYTFYVRNGTMEITLTGQFAADRSSLRGQVFGLSTSPRAFVFQRR